MIAEQKSCRVKYIKKEEKKIYLGKVGKKIVQGFATKAIPRKKIKGNQVNVLKIIGGPKIISYTQLCI